MRKHLPILFALCSATGCDRATGLRTIEPVIVLVGHPSTSDGGTVGATDAGTACTLPFGGPDCCGDTNQRVGEATCTGAEYVCGAGSLCSCAGSAATFHCVDVCGGDGFVSAVCLGSEWGCPQGLIKTSDCEPGTCFGDPGECCIAPHCEAGQWTCESIRDPCR